MAVIEKVSRRAHAHTIYKLKDGTRVPGCTTISGLLDKPALIKWANNMGLQGIDTTRYVDELADAGTLAHYMITCDLKGEHVDPSYLMDFNQLQKNGAETGYLKYLDWKKQHKIEDVVLVETPLVSERHRFGGTCDALLLVDGLLTLIDIKTCKALYGPKDEKWTQVAGYSLLLIDNGHTPGAHYILRVGRNDAEGFEYAPMPKLDLHYKRFLNLRQQYEINKQLES